MSSTTRATSHLLLPNRGGPHDHELLRGTYFDLLRQLQNAVRTVILTATVSNHCVRCSDGHCKQLFLLLRNCLLAGCHRFPGASPVTDDLLLLLIVPEYIGTFLYDLDFVAYLCISRGISGLVRQLFEDDARIQHFYLECAIMADEELYLAFVSSLLALEPVNFHPDSPLLAQLCMSASLQNSCFTPVLWAKKQHAGRLEDSCCAAAVPDRFVPKSDLAALASIPSKNMFEAFIAKPASDLQGLDDSGRPCEQAADASGLEQDSLRGDGETSNDVINAEEPTGVQDHDVNVASSVEREDEQSSSAPAEATDTSLKLADAAMALDETEMMVRELEKLGALTESSGLESRSNHDQAAHDDEGKPVNSRSRLAVSGDEALLQPAMLDCASVLCLEDPVFGNDFQELSAAADSQDEGGKGLDDEDGQASAISAEVSQLEAVQVKVAEALGRASDLGAELADAFGLEVTLDMEPGQKLGLSLLDVVVAGSRARASSDVPLSYRGAKDQAMLEPRRSEPFLEDSFKRPWPHAWLEKDSGAMSEAHEADEASDAIAALEGLWDASRKDAARRLMRQAGGSVGSRQRPQMPALDLPSGSSCLRSDLLDGVAGALSRSTVQSSSSNSSTRAVSPASSTVVTPRGSGSLGVGQGVQQDALSDSGSECSSHQSVFSAQIESSTPSSSKSGLHLEWNLTLRHRLPAATQVSLQRGCCHGCQARLPPTTLFTKPRYCHYLGCLFCTNCHVGDMRVIPARVVERWDFEPRKVCSVAAQYLDLQVNQALVPITRIKQTRISSQEVLTEIHTYRQMLTRIKQVVAQYGCSFSSKLESFLSKLDVHVARGHEHYAMQDLIRIELQGRKCPLFVNIAQVVAVAAKHIRSCTTCMACSSICQICASGSPVFPFEIETFHSCQGCNAIFHKACFKRADSQCPLCLMQPTAERGSSVANVRPR